MFDTIADFFHRVNIDTFERLDDHLYRVHHNDLTKLVYFPTLTVPPWTEWRNGGKQFQISFFTASIRAAMRSQGTDDILVVCTPIGQDDVLSNSKINKVSLYLTASQSDYEAGDFANVHMNRKGPSYRHSDFVVILKDFNVQASRPDIRTLFVLHDAPDEVAYRRVLHSNTLGSYYKGSQVEDAVRLNIEPGKGLNTAQQAFLDCLFEPSSVLSTIPDIASPPVTFTQHNSVPNGARIREYNQRNQVLADLHGKLQLKLKRILENNAAKKGHSVSIEWPIGNNRRVDAATHFGNKATEGELHLYEIKTAETATECVRQAIGQLYEYTYMCGLDAFSITNLIIVGPSPSTPAIEAMLKELSDGKAHTIRYLHLPVK